MPFEYPKRSDPRDLSEPARIFPEPTNNLPEPSTPSGGLSKSTKTLLIIVASIIVIVVLFFIIRGIIKTNPNETPINKLTADLKISEVQIINYTDLSVKIEKGNSGETIGGVNFIFYDEQNSKILTRKISAGQLEENNFQVVLNIPNTSVIKSISITPIFVDQSGDNVLGKVEDTYNVSDEEKYNEVETPIEDNTSNIQKQPDCISDSDCNDNNSCTTNTCLNGNCTYTPIKNCVSCELSSQCNDSNSCTTNTCLNGNCTYTPIKNCVSCELSSQCNDSNTCTTDVCSEGKCTYLQIPGCTPCVSNLNCEDYNSCTNNMCFQGRCLYTPISDCKNCTLDSECDKGNPCTNNLCLNNTCSYTPISGCKSCTSSSQCNDNDSSTTDTCLDNKCKYTKITACINNDGYCPSGCNYTNDNNCVYVPICGNGIREGTEKCDGNSFGGASCEGVLGAGYTGTLKCTNLCTFNTSLCMASCTCPSDNNSCTNDKCVNNVCQHIPLTGTACSSDNNACTNDICSSSGVCLHPSITSCTNGDGCCPSECTSLNDNNCLQCTTANQATACNDNSVCTADSCSNNLCSHSGIVGCCTSNSQCASNQICNSNNACVSSCAPSCSGKNCGSDGCGANNNCGSCSLANAVSSCSASYQCIISSCNSGYANCDSNANNGCETQLGTTSNCASCGNACSTGQTCNSNGVCVGNSNPPPRGGAIIIDHTTTDISKIPACWIEKAKAITLQYAHRSDGGNLLQGLDYLYSANSALKYGLKVDSLPSQTNPIQLRIMDGNPPMSSYSYPDQYWDSAEARVATEANWASGQFDVSMWSWCSEFDVGSSGASETAALAQLYLTTMNSMEADYPNIKFVYMTSYTNNGNSYLVADNQLIRDYAKNNNKILYDFEDIGKCDPSGYCYSGADRACTWCTSWCTSHPSDCVNLPSCGHADATNGGLICVQRSKALWWLMARLAGWDGNPSDGC